MTMPGRGFQAGKYRYGFNGKEKDNEVKGDGNQQDYGMRIYDPRLGRFLSVDPLQKSYPELTPYQFASNGPIANIDLDGLEACPAMIDPHDRRTSTQKFVDWLFNTSMEEKLVAVVKPVTDDINTIGTHLQDPKKENTGKVALASLRIGLMFAGPELLSSKGATVVKVEEAGSVALKTETRVAEVAGGESKASAEAASTKTSSRSASNTSKAAINTPLQTVTNGGSVEILGGKGAMTLNAKSGLLEGSFTQGKQTVNFDAQIKINGKTIDFEEVGIYGESGYGTTAAQNQVKPSIFKALLSEIEDFAKASGFDDGSIQFVRRRPDGSPLPDSNPRSIPLKIKKD